MVKNSGGHSALLVTLSDDNKILVDPFYGYITIAKNGTPIHPKDAKNFIGNGGAFEDVFTSLGKTSTHNFYKDINSMFMGAEGESLTIEATPAPLIDGKTLTWELEAGEGITFRDGDAKISLKRMNSYIPVDQIIIYPLEN